MGSGKTGTDGSVLASSLDQSDTQAMLPAAPKGENLWPEQLLMPTQLTPRQYHRLILVCCLAMSCISPALAAPPTTAPKAAPVSVSVRTAGNLADACTVKPANRTDFARLNFCNGFAQGVLQTNQQSQNGTKICIPSPSPKRSETMAEFARWVRADASRKDDLASTAFLQFMAGRFPC